MPNIPPGFELYEDDILSTDKIIKGYVDQDCIVSVKINGKTYSANCKTNEDFSISIPKVSVGTKITIIAQTKLGHTNREIFTVKQGKSDVGILYPIYCADDYVEILCDNLEKNDKLVLTIGNKKYSKKITSSKSEQYVKFKTKKMKKNSIITTTLYDSDGNIKGTDKCKVKILKSSIKLKNKIFRYSKKANVKVSKLQKGDKVKLKVGKKAYIKKVKKNSKNKTFSFNVTKANAGSKVTITVYDKYNNKKASKKSRVYYGTKVYVGMSTKTLKLTTWGAPDYINYYSNDPQQWVYERDFTTLYVYVKNGKVVSYQKFH